MVIQGNIIDILNKRIYKGEILVEHAAEHSLVVFDGIRIFEAIMPNLFRFRPFGKV